LQYLKLPKIIRLCIFYHFRDHLRWQVSYFKLQKT